MNRRNLLHTLCGLWLGGLSACASQQAGPSAPAADKPGGSAHVPQEPEALRHPPPPAGVVTPPEFPATQRRELPNGLGVSVLQRPGLPVVRVLLSFQAGRSREGDQVGVAQLTLRMLKATRSPQGTPFLDDFRALGTGVELSSGSDHTSLGLTAIVGDFDPALSLLGKLVSAPQLSYTDFTQIKALELERTQNLARGHLDWGNQMVLYRELFELPTGVHPYAYYDATPSQVERLKFEDCRAWRKEQLSPTNAELIVVGSLEFEQVFAAASHAFGSWSGEPRPSAVRFDRPAGPQRFRIFVVDHPDSALSEVLLGTLGAPRASRAWPALALATHLLGEGPGSRLFMELQEKRRLALRTKAQLVPLLSAPALVQLQASAEPDHTSVVTGALIQQVKAMQASAPTTSEVEHAARALTGGFLNHADPLLSLTGMLAVQRRFELAGDYYNGFHQEVLALEPEQLHDIVKPYFHSEHAVVVVGADASRVEKSLSGLAEVVVVDPEKDFAIKRTLPYDPLATK